MLLLNIRKVFSMLWVLKNISAAGILVYAVPFYFAAWLNSKGDSPFKCKWSFNDKQTNVNFDKPAPSVRVSFSLAPSWPQAYL